MVIGYAITKQPVVQTDDSGCVVSVEMKLDLHISSNVYNVWLKMHKTQQSIQIQGGSKVLENVSAAKYFSEKCMIPCIESQIMLNISTIDKL